MNLEADQRQEQCLVEGTEDPCCKKTSHWAAHSEGPLRLMILQRGRQEEEIMCGAGNLQAQLQYCGEEKINMVLTSPK